MKQTIFLPANPVGTSLMGYLYITHAELIATLGKPQEKYSDKSKAYWYLTEHNTQIIFTIYDYCGEEKGSVKNITEWHIGGNDENVLNVVNNIFPNAKVKRINGDLIHDGTSTSVPEPAKKTTKYLIKWEIDIEDVATPEEAAQQAFDHITRDGTSACIFTVIDKSTNETIIVDLWEDVEEDPY